MRITMHDDGGLVARAEIDLRARKATEFAIDDEKVEDSFIGLNTLIGCVEAVLIDVLKQKERSRGA